MGCSTCGTVTNGKVSGCGSGGGCSTGGCNRLNVYDWFAELGREKQKNFIKYALFFTRETMMLSNGLSTKLEGEEIVYAQRFVPYLSIEKLEKIAVFLNKLHYYIERNANPKSQMTAFCIRMSNIIAEKEVEMVSY